MLGEHSSIILLFKSVISSLSEIRIANLSSPATLRVVVDPLILASQLCYVLEQLELFLIMLLLESINSAFFLQIILNIYVVISK